MNLLGETTKAILKKSESHKLAEQFEVADSVATITLSTALIASNVVNINVNGSAIEAETFATSHAVTMAAIVAKLEALDTVTSASYSGNVISIVPVEQEANSLIQVTVTAGATQPTVVIDGVLKEVKPLQPLVLNTDGTVKAAVDASGADTIIGYSVHSGKPSDLVTAVVKGFMIINAVATADSTTAGSVKSSGGVDADGFPKVANIAAANAAQIGWALDEGDEGDVVRVLLR